VASHAGPVPARSAVAPEARPAPDLVVEDPAAGFVGAALEARGIRAADDRGEGAGELALEPLDAGSADRLEVDEVAAVWVGLQLRAHRQAAGDGVQLGQLAAGERAAGRLRGPSAAVSVTAR